jgi:hypothetical protein
VIFSVSILALLFLVPYLALHKESAGLKEVKIFKDNKLVAEEGLDTDRIVKVGNMDIEINNGRVHVKDSDCPKEVCKSFGWISSPGQSIICVPNKVIIEVSGRQEEPDYVVMSY